MSFRVFASGFPHFHYVKDNNPDEDVFETAAVLNALRSASPSGIGVVEGAADYLTPNSYLGGLKAMARMEFLHLLKNAVCFLAMHPRAKRGWISVVPVETHLIWPDTGALARYTFTPGHDPGTEFFRKINPALEAADMSNYGVLRVLALVLSKYDRYVGDSDEVRIQIELTH